jgi:hypothetical protein
MNEKGWTHKNLFEDYCYVEDNKEISTRRAGWIVKMEIVRRWCCADLHLQFESNLTEEYRGVSDVNVKTRSRKYIFG